MTFFYIFLLDQDADKSATLGASNDLNDFTVEGLIEDVKARDKVSCEPVLHLPTNHFYI